MDPEQSESSEQLRSLEMDKIGELLDDGRYPVSTEELLEEYGDVEINYPNGSEQLTSILETSGAEEYRTSDEVELAVLNGVGREAVGRPRYSDRSSETGEREEFERDQESF